MITSGGKRNPAKLGDESRPGPGRSAHQDYQADGPDLYYEDGYQEYAERGDEIKTAPIGAVDWVEVDNHADLERAREIAWRC